MKALTELMEPKTYEEGSIKIAYRVYVPEVITENCTLVLYLHGAGERGSDNEKHITCNGNFLERYFSEGYDKTHPAVVIAPQCPEVRPNGEEGRWIEQKWEKDTYKELLEETKEINTVVSLCRYYIDTYDLDKEKTVITGLSMGGFGTWDILERYPGLFRTAVPVCGGASTDSAHNIKDVKIWTFHGDADDIVPVKLTRDVVEVLKKNGANIKYSEYKGADHGSWSIAYKEEELFSWIFDF